MIPQRGCVDVSPGRGRGLFVAVAWTAAALQSLAPGAADAADAAAAKSPGAAAERAVDAMRGLGASRDPAAAARSAPDPLAGTPPIKPEQTGQSAEQILARLARPRTDSWADWVAPLEPLHYCGEPRALAPCVPPPPCHPSRPPAPYDLVGDRGEPTCGPIYGGPCAPRTGTHDDGPHPRFHRVHDRFFDWFYMWK